MRVLRAAQQHLGTVSASSSTFVLEACNGNEGIGMGVSVRRWWHVRRRAMGVVRVATEWVVMSIVRVVVWVVRLWSRHGRRNLELNDKSLVKVLVPWHYDL